MRLLLDDRISMCARCVEGFAEVADDWVNTAARHRGEAGNAAVETEEWLAGLAVIARQLRLTIQTLRALNRGTPLKLPGRVFRDDQQRLRVPVFPTSGYFDSLTFMGLSGTVRLQDGVEADKLHGALVDTACAGNYTEICAVLGAGNVSSIPVLDSLNRIMFDCQKVVLKLNPVNDYLASFLQVALKPLIEGGVLQVITGGADVGRDLVHHKRVTHVHLTGSAATHDAIVWGTTPDGRPIDKQTARPILNKVVTSELGNVSPWIIVPGKYSARQLKSQAEHIATSITNNVSFNCLATKMIVTSADWDQRGDFLALLQRFLKSTPKRCAYYPGAAERFERVTGKAAPDDDRGALPYTLLAGQKISERPELFTEESFVCVCGETTLQASSPASFLTSAVEFVNERMEGSLCASITLPPGFEGKHSQETSQALDRIRYGSVCLNQWSGLAYGLISPPWGAHPGGTLENVGSGIGAVHNTYLLDGFEKTILRGPLVNFPKPIWFPQHAQSLAAAKRLFSLYHRDSALALPSLFVAAMRG